MGKKECSIGICCFLWASNLFQKMTQDIESDQEEPECEQCQVERQISKTEPQFSIVKDMTPLA